MNIARPILAVDVVVFAVLEGELCVLLHTRQRSPFVGAPSLPGVALEVDETLLHAAHRALGTLVQADEAFLGGLHLEQLAAFDGLYRDPRERSVSIAYLGATRPNVGQFVGTWQRVSTLSPGSLPFDHPLILQTAHERLRSKLKYTNIARTMLATPFPIDTLRHLYECVLGRPFNRSNFRTRLEKIGLVERLDEKYYPPGGGRPAHLYRFSEGVDAVEDFI